MKDKYSILNEVKVNIDEYEEVSLIIMIILNRE